jgi:hypothetical protein
VLYRLLWRRRLVKKRACAIDYRRGQDKERQLYRELIAATHASRAELQAAVAGLAEIAGTTAERWRAEVAHYLPLIARILAQSERRMLNGETVPAGDKLVSLFEPHADIILKGGRQANVGARLKCHRLCKVEMTPGRPGGLTRPQLLPEPCATDGPLSAYPVPPDCLAAAGVGPKSAYRSRTSDNTRSRYPSGRRLLLGRPRRFETKLAAPPCFKPASNRKTWRRFRPSNSQASATRRRPDRTPSKTSSRILAD